MLLRSQREYTSVSSSAYNLSHPYQALPWQEEGGSEGRTSNPTWTPTEHGTLRNGVYSIENASSPSCCAYVRMTKSEAVRGYEYIAVEGFDPRQVMQARTFMIYNNDIKNVFASDAVTEASTYIAHSKPA